MSFWNRVIYLFIVPLENLIEISPNCTKYSHSKRKLLVGSWKILRIQRRYTRSIFPKRCHPWRGLTTVRPFWEDRNLKRFSFTEGTSSVTSDQLLEKDKGLRSRTLNRLKDPLKSRKVLLSRTTTSKKPRLPGSSPLEWYSGVDVGKWSVGVSKVFINWWTLHWPLVDLRQSIGLIQNYKTLFLKWYFNCNVSKSNEVPRKIVF